ncbi:MAG: hypothetical protein EPGJADBJ_02710 [Saprospiraceae bacterium]|nr:hypothetical protein [Saprospiraceae bacterium]
MVDFVFHGEQLREAHRIRQRASVGVVGSVEADIGGSGVRVGAVIGCLNARCQANVFIQRAAKGIGCRAADGNGTVTGTERLAVLNIYGAADGGAVVVKRIILNADPVVGQRDRRAAGGIRRGEQDMGEIRSRGSGRKGVAADGHVLGRTAENGDVSVIQKLVVGHIDRYAGIVVFDHQRLAEGGRSRLEGIVVDIYRRGIVVGFRNIQSCASECIAIYSGSTATGKLAKQVLGGGNNLVVGHRASHFAQPDAPAEYGGAGTRCDVVVVEGAKFDRAAVAQQGDTGRIRIAERSGQGASRAGRVDRAILNGDVVDVFRIYACCSVGTVYFNVESVEGSARSRDGKYFLVGACGGSHRRITQTVDGHVFVDGHDFRIGASAHFEHVAVGSSSHPRLDGGVVSRAGQVFHRQVQDGCRSRCGRTVVVRNGDGISADCQ